MHGVCNRIPLTAERLCPQTIILLQAFDVGFHLSVTFCELALSHLYWQHEASNALWFLHLLIFSGRSTGLDVSRRPSYASDCEIL
jgi:hypothetical protein